MSTMANDDDKSTPSAARTRNQKTKNPCGTCSKECIIGNGSSLPCGGACNFLYHTSCIDGMTPEFADNCETMAKIHGISPFFCLICRRFIEFSNTTFKQQADEIKAAKDETKEVKNLFKDETKELKNQIKLLTAEIKLLTKKVAKLELKTDKVEAETDRVKENVVRV